MTTDEYMERVFYNNQSQRCHYYNRYNDNHTEEEKDTLYMTIPIKGDAVEIPIFIMDTFMALVAGHGVNNTPDEISVSIKSKAYSSGYKSFDRSIKIALNEEYNNSKLVILEGKDGNEKKTYYATKSALFDKDFKPLMIATWQLRKVTRGLSRTKWFFDKPILRLTPDFYLSKHDNVGRFVCKKMLHMIYDVHLFVPSRHYYDIGFEAQDEEDYKPNVIIGNIPFKMKKVSVPSITTANQDLLKVALDNLEDIV